MDVVCFVAVGVKERFQSGGAHKCRNMFVRNHSCRLPGQFPLSKSIGRQRSRHVVQNGLSAAAIRSPLPHCFGLWRGLSQTCASYHSSHENAGVTHIVAADAATRCLPIRSAALSSVADATLPARRTRRGLDKSRRHLANHCLRLIRLKDACIHGCLSVQPAVSSKTPI